jgi:signal transduction histidine kinase
MFKKLRKSIMLFNILTVSLVLIAAFSIIYLVTAQNIERENAQRLQAMQMIFLSVDNAPPRTEPNRPAPYPANDTRFSVEFGGSFTLFILNDELVNVNSQLNLDQDVYTAAFTQTKGEQNGKLILAGRTWQYMQLPPPIMLSANYTRIAFLDITHNVSILQTLLLTLLGVGLAVLLALIFISYRFAIYAVQPIEQNYNKQKQFITDASHELRTPLAIIGANIDAIASSGEETVNSQQEWLGYIRFELTRIGKLVNDLLELAMSEQTKPQENQPFDLSVVCETASASMEAVLFDDGITLETAIAPSLCVKGDSEKLTRVLYILLDNASKYTPQGGKITLQLQQENQQAVLRVSNTGEGISLEDLPHIFDRFYRTDQSRSSTIGGSGLGLSIAKSIVDQLKGSLTCESANGLTTFSVRLPM